MDRVCHALFLSAQAHEKDSNLAFVRGRMLGVKESDGQAADILTLYSRIRVGRIVENDPADPRISTLLLCGIARVADCRHRRVLRVRNRIYAQAFDHRWIRDSMPDADARRQRAVLRKAILQAGVSWLLAGAGLLAALWQVRIAHRAAVRTAALQDQSRAMGQERDRLSQANAAMQGILAEADQSLRGARTQYRDARRESEAAKAEFPSRAPGAGGSPPGHGTGTAAGGSGGGKARLGRASCRAGARRTRQRPGCGPLNAA